MLFCIKVAVKLIATYLLVKLELFLNETCKTSRHENDDETLMNLKQLDKSRIQQVNFLHKM